MSRGAAQTSPLSMLCDLSAYQTQSRNLPTYFFSFWAFAALAKAFAGNEFWQNPRGYGLNSGRASPLEIF